MYNSIAKGMRILNKRFGKNKIKKYLRSNYDFKLEAI